MIDIDIKKFSDGDVQLVIGGPDDHQNAIVVLSGTTFNELVDGLVSVRDQRTKRFQMTCTDTRDAEGAL